MRFLVPALCLVLAFPGAAQEIPPGTPEASGPELRLEELFRAAAGADFPWRPDWPLNCPPDLFSVPGAASISAELDDGTKLEMFRRDNRFPAFPVPARLPGSEGNESAPSGDTVSAERAFSQAGESPVLLQGQAEYDSQDRLLKLGWSEDADAEILRWDEEGRPVLARIFTGDYYFAALAYPEGKTEETWFDREGNPVTELPPELLLDFDSQGRISRIRAPWGSRRALYNPRNMPLYLELESPGGETVTYRYQWDEAGRLVRLSGGPADKPAELRYEYVLDSRGNWTERRETAMAEAGGRLVPVRTGTVKRFIHYETTADGSGQN